MNRRILGGAVFIIALATVTIAIGRKVQPSANAFSAAAPQAVSSHKALGAQPRSQTADNDSSAQAEEVPEYVVYGMLFREVNEFGKKAKEKENRGENASVLRNFHRNKAGLDEKQTKALEKIAADCQSEVEVVEREARKIIRDARAQHPGGLLAKGEVPPAPPAELKKLNEQRIQAILKARNVLRASFGEREFQRFDALSKKEAAEKMRPAQFARPRTKVPGEEFGKRARPSQAK